MKNPMFFLYAADDEHLSRLDPTLLSTQALLEIFVSSFKNISEFQDENGNFLDITDWRSLEILDPDRDAMMVTNFTYPTNDNQPNLGGSLNLAFLPQTIDRIEIIDCDVTGTIGTADLPPDLIALMLQFNKLKGSFAIEKLPETIEALMIHSNLLCGSLRIDALPRSMITFHANDNAFVGTIDVRDLPETLYYLEIQNNKFSGNVVKSYRICFNLS